MKKVYRIKVVNEILLGQQGSTGTIMDCSFGLAAGEGEIKIVGQILASSPGPIFIKVSEGEKYFSPPLTLIKIGPGDVHRVGVALSVPFCVSLLFRSLFHMIMKSVDADARSHNREPEKTAITPPPPPHTHTHRGVAPDVTRVLHH